MDTKEQKITRDELYELAWSMPMTHLAKKFGLSDVGLRKICIKHKIAIPTIGYWNKVHHGKSVPRKLLPALNPQEKERLNTIIIRRTEPNTTSLLAQLNPEISQVEEFEQKEANIISVPDRLFNPCTLVRLTKTELLKRKPDKYGRVSTWDMNCLPVMVCKPSINRAMRIMNALIFAFEARGYEVVKRDQKYPAVKVCGEEVEFSIEEKVNQSDYIPTKEEIIRNKDYSWTSWPKYKYAPTGQLSLKINNYVSDIRKIWSDKRSKPLEEQLNAFVIGLVLTAFQEKKRREDRELQNKLWEEQRKKEAELASLKAREQARRDQLLKDANNYQNALMIRRYIHDVIQKVNGQKLTDSFQNWKKWAETVADELDTTHQFLNY